MLSVFRSVEPGPSRQINLGLSSGYQNFTNGAYKYSVAIRQGLGSPSSPPLIQTKTLLY